VAESQLIQVLGENILYTILIKNGSNFCQSGPGECASGLGLKQHKYSSINYLTSGAFGVT
jgi:hypothetical protein